MWMSHRTQRDLDAQSRIGQVERTTGTVLLIRSGPAVKKINVGNLEFLSPTDSVETTEGSEARLVLENGAIVRLLAESLVNLERNEMSDGTHDVLVIQRGEIVLELPGKEGEFFISKNGKRIASTLYKDSTLASEPVERPAPAEFLVTDSNVGLTEDEINTVVSGQKSNFTKCYTTLLQKDPQAKGELSLNFTIENSGKIGFVEINSAQLQNDEFKKCLSTVLSRVQFRTFEGSAISTFFPLKFE